MTWSVVLDFLAVDLNKIKLNWLSSVFFTLLLSMQMFALLFIKLFLDAIDAFVCIWSVLFF